MATKKSAKESASARQAASAGRMTRGADLQVELPDVGPVVVIQMKAANVVQHLGGPSNVASILRVARSQPGRWVRGVEAPSAKSAKHLLDLDYVLSRLEGVYDSETAETWLTSPNSFLNGARPLDVLLTDGPSKVIEAIDATIAGSYA